MDVPKLKDWLNDILSRDASTFEDAYWGDRPVAFEAIPALISQLEIQQDSYTRGKLIELLGESEDLSVLPILQQELDHP
ncbi:MAG: hypothetical protein ACE37H_01000 [Phycisphaeraceae bacterium]